MKKVLLIGKINKAIQNLNDCLHDVFQVQLCSESVELVRGMLKITKPHLVVISVIELEGAETEIFDLLWNTYSRIPVIVIGNKEECDAYQGYFENEQFTRFLRPVSKNRLVEKCCEKLHMELSKEFQNPSSIKEPVSVEKSILVVDDSAFALRSIKSMLEKKYKVFLANSAETAVKQIRKNRPDLILLDYEMPGIDGRKTFEMLREQEEFRDIPVVFLTAVSDKKHILAVLRLNPAGYFLKPLEQEKILKAIGEILAE